MIQLVWLTLLAMHTGAAAVWWWLMPGGIPSSATAFWVDQVAPPIMVAALLAALLARGRLSQAICRRCSPPSRSSGWPSASRRGSSFPRASRPCGTCRSSAAPRWPGCGRSSFAFGSRPWWVLALAAALVGWEFPSRSTRRRRAPGRSASPSAPLRRAPSDRQARPPEPGRAASARRRAGGRAPRQADAQRGADALVR